MPVLSLDHFTCFVPGTPRPQGSKKAFVRGGRAMMLDASTDTLSTWRRDMLSHFAARLPDVGNWDADSPVVADLTFVFARPRSHYGTGRNSSTLKPNAPTLPVGSNIGDIDKLVRAVLDSLVNAGVIADDSLVWQACASKLYVSWSSPRPGVHVQINGNRM